MYQRFISLQWKAFYRSASFGRSMGLKIFMAFIAIYFSLVFLTLGIGLYPLLKEAFPEQEPLQIVNRFLLVYLVLELLMRFMLQTLPVMTVKPLLSLPVGKGKVVNYVLLRSLFSFFNFLPLLLFIPFAVFTGYKTEYSLLSITAWTVAVIGLDLSVNYLNFLLKKRFADDLKALLPYLVVALVLYALERFEVFSITEVFAEGLNYVLEMPFLALLPLLLVFGLYRWNQKVLKSRLYLDESLREKVTEAKSQDFAWLRRFGGIAPFLQLDLKLIWRNKRPKTLIYISLLILGYGMIFYPQDTYQDMPSVFVFVGIFMTGIFMINFGQFIPAWDSSYYSMMMSQNIPLKQYLDAKAALIIFSIVILTILTTPYVFFGYNILIINIVCAIYNIGINVPVLLFAGSFNRKRIDLEKSPFMNYQGTGAAQWLVGLPLLIVPILIFWVLNKFVSFEVATLVLGALGFLGIVFRSSIMKQITEAYRKNKYAMINGFKQTGE
ncbi:hypothetical protein JRG66_07110 [Salinimicrobium tongyeongense]|uniref:ABC-2 type transport system permease protein n=1 Tax=Salinimicrobium tongyeongense TaxID=2809707 RepID=A0ABY6NUM5_9FLAO|nr:DUF5687 family protein [Salinimicrobium tongyeongense]UZH56614.1 hypothetical protein JRG66_07110 [Salinimicrobium tongyeongense]